MRSFRFPGVPLHVQLEDVALEVRGDVRGHQHRHRPAVVGWEDVVVELRRQRVSPRPSAVCSTAWSATRGSSTSAGPRSRRVRRGPERHRRGPVQDKVPGGDSGGVGPSSGAGTGSARSDACGSSCLRIAEPIRRPSTVASYRRSSSSRTVPRIRSLALTFRRLGLSWGRRPARSTTGSVAGGPARCGRWRGPPRGRRARHRRRYGRAARPHPAHPSSQRRPARRRTAGLVVRSRRNSGRCAAPRGRWRRRRSVCRPSFSAFPSLAPVAVRRAPVGIAGRGRSLSPALPSELSAGGRRPWRPCRHALPGRLLAPSSGVGRRSDHGLVVGVGAEQPEYRPRTDRARREIVHRAQQPRTPATGRRPRPRRCRRGTAPTGAPAPPCRSPARRGRRPPRAGPCVDAHRWACTRRNCSRSPTCNALTS